MSASFSRRIKRVDVNPPQTYCSINNASAMTGIAPSSLRNALDTGIFFGGVWESIDPPRKGFKVEVDGIVYASFSDAARNLDVSARAFSFHFQKGRKEFQIKNFKVKIIED